MANTILEQVKLFMSMALQGQADISDELIEEFGERCKDILKRKFREKRPDEFQYRISELGRPLCQLQMAKAGAEAEQMPYSTLMKFLYGDIIEALAFTILKGAGVNVQAEQVKVVTEIEGQHVQGHLDLEIDDKVYDLKSASKWQFEHKFAAGNDGFQEMVKDDPFGYLGQSYMYAELRGKKFGGWIAINKETGEWAVLEPPPVDVSYKNGAVGKVKDNVVALSTNKPFQRCFEPEKETFYRKPTGNTVLSRTCQYCVFKHKCWEGEGLQYAENPRSKAEYKSKNWYLGEIK